MLHVSHGQKTDKGNLLYNFIVLFVEDTYTDVMHVLFLLFTYLDSENTRH